LEDFDLERVFRGFDGEINSIDYVSSSHHARFAQPETTASGFDDLKNGASSVV
jgi:hypothetical protein